MFFEYSVCYFSIMFLSTFARFPSTIRDSYVKCIHFIKHHLSLCCFILHFISLPFRFLPPLRDRVVHRDFFFDLWRLVRPQGYYQDLRSILMHPRSPCMKSRSPTQARARLDFQEARRGTPTNAVND